MHISPRSSCAHARHDAHGCKAGTLIANSGSGDSLVSAANRDAAAKARQGGRHSAGDLQRPRKPPRRRDHYLTRTLALSCGSGFIWRFFPEIGRPAAGAPNAYYGTIAQGVKNVSMPLPEQTVGRVVRLRRVCYLVHLERRSYAPGWW